MSTLGACIANSEAFPILRKWNFFNHAGVAPLPRAAAEIGHAFVDDFVARGAVGFVGWERKIERVRECSAETFAASGMASPSSQWA